MYSNELGIICTVMDIEATQALDFAEYDDETDDEGSGGNDEGSGGNKKPVLRSHLMWLISLCVCTHTNHTKFHILCVHIHTIYEIWYRVIFNVLDWCEVWSTLFGIRKFYDQFLQILLQLATHCLLPRRVVFSRVKCVMKHWMEYLFDSGCIFWPVNRKFN